MKIKIILTSIIILLSINALNSQEILTYSSNWKYFKGIQASPANWQSVAFDDSQWPDGNAPFSYGITDNGTVFQDMKDSFTCIFLRKKINVTIADSLIKKLIFTTKFQDGFRLWLNDQIILEQNVPDSATFDTVAIATHSYNNSEEFEIGKTSAGIKKGENVIAVQCFTKSKSNAGFYFDVKIDASPKLISGPEVRFDVNGGYFTSGFDLTLTSENVGDTILYTYDCSEPSASKTVKKGISPFTFKVDTNSFAGRPKTPAVVIRAVVSKYGYDISNSESRTYIFTKALRKQSYPGAPWPVVNNNDDIGQIIDYAMDPIVMNDTRYNSKLDAAFQAVPTFSIVTEVKNLFDPTTGIYVNAMMHGQAWERPGSLELLDFKGKEGFSVNTGLRIRGGWSRHNDNPKHAFRIFMKDDYGKSKLKYPLFENEGVDEFDKFDLRCAQNYSWSYGCDPRFTYTRDVFSRDAQGASGNPYTRSRYYHLFVDGMYWGLYQTEERPEANFAASYLGGDKDNYDVIKKADAGGIEATDGDMNLWQKVWNITQKGYKTNTNYYLLQGLNANGQFDTTLTKYVDIDNLIDYMLNIFYTGNFDAPVSKFGQNNGVNNYFAIKHKKRTREGFIFLAHDSEHTMLPDAASPGIGISENRVNIGNLASTNRYKMVITSFSQFNPQWLHHKLTENAEYRLRFADRAYKTLAVNGIFTPIEAEKMWRNRAAQIDQAVICESARWGDSRGWGRNTRDNNWIPAVNNVVDGFIKKRTPIVIGQLQEVGLWPDIEAPLVNCNGTQYDYQSFDLQTIIKASITNPNDAGDIYYTLDGSDPRMADGMINPNATQIIEGAEINISYALRLKSRILLNDSWSALHEVLFTNKLNRDNLKITEIQYSPVSYGSQEPKDIEFIEIKNTGTKGADLGGMRLDSAVSFTFPTGTIINPGGFVVVASNRNGFEFLYSVQPTGEFKGSLKNEGEQIVLLDENNNRIVDVTYETEYPWPIKAEGTGFSLVAAISYPDSDPNQPNYWIGSRLKYGSPFSDDSTYIPLNVRNIYNTAKSIQVYPNPCKENINIQSINENILNVSLFDLNGRLVLKENMFNETQKTISLTKYNLTEGVYVLKVRTDSGLKIEKIVYRR